MGSPLGVLFANFFMGCIEEEVFKKINKPSIYCRYIDDIFIKTENDEEIQDLRRHLQETSGLKFTIENSVDAKIPFLDVLVKQEAESFNTEVYTKPTNPGHCMNGRSECPERYLNSTINAYIRRALTHCSTWKQVHEEIKRSTQVLLMNGFKEENIEKQIKNTLDKYQVSQSTSKEDNKNTIKLYYRAFYSTAYKEEERIIKQIVRRNVSPTDQDKKIDLIIYYKSKKTSHLLLKNSPRENKQPSEKSHVVYRFSCKQGNCESLNTTYIGMTTTKLSRRLTYHLTAGAPKNHMKNHHNTTLTREILIENTEIIDCCTDPRRLPILEALYIKELKPSLNAQHTDLQALPSMRRTNSQQEGQSASSTSS